MSKRTKFMALLRIRLPVPSNTYAYYSSNQRVSWVVAALVNEACILSLLNKDELTFRYGMQ